MAMKVYVFGNQDVSQDSVAIDVAETFEDQVEGIEFIVVSPNEDVPFADDESVVIMDVVDGIDGPTLIEGDDIEKIQLPPRSTVHDFDLGFQLKYLKKLGKLGDVKIIGLPMTDEMDYDSIQSIFKKLVAQDMQGS